MALPLARADTHASFSLFQEENTGSQRCLEMHIYTHANTHSGQHWFPVWHYLAVSDTAEGIWLFSGPQCSSVHSVSISYLTQTPSQHFTGMRKQSDGNSLSWSLAPSLLHHWPFLLLHFIVSGCASFSCSVCIFPSRLPFSLKEMGFSWLHAAVLTARLVRHNVEPSNR